MLLRGFTVCEIYKCCGHTAYKQACCSSVCKDFITEFRVYFQFCAYRKLYNFLNVSLIVCSPFWRLCCELVCHVIFQETSYNETTDMDNLLGTPVFEGMCLIYWFILSIQVLFDVHDSCVTYTPVSYLSWRFVLVSTPFLTNFLEFFRTSRNCNLVSTASSSTQYYPPPLPALHDWPASTYVKESGIN